ncbi:unnamed protein product [Cylindrotheca closterium]|uniref:Fatty acid hydroxylase domain-containing protein n=1 Tax=Cylindrotheca closterium TaxID=2856 RepID=A0AAD2GB51_9STRA|nr:unnamed protein product [Cylindrotheca closterium]
MLIVDGQAARFLTQLVDYARFYAVVICTVLWATNEQEKRLVCWKAALMPVAIVTSHTIMEVVYGHILGPNTLGQSKRNQIRKDERNVALIGGVALLVFQMSCAVGFLTYIGAFTPTFVHDKSNLLDWTLALSTAYGEFWILSWLKDVTSMHFVHRLMHNKNYKYLHRIHLLHHSHTTNLNNINGALLEPVDLFLENTIGPLLLVVLKCLSGYPPKISLISFLYSISAEGSNHSLNPYSISYYFPPVDFFLKGNLAHNLHHTSPNGHFHAQPWHHLWEGYHKDLEAYNRIMKTKVEF